MTLPCVNANKVHGRHQAAPEGLKLTFPTVLVPHQTMFPGPRHVFPCDPVSWCSGAAGAAWKGEGRLFCRQERASRLPARDGAAGAAGREQVPALCLCALPILSHQEKGR